MKETRYVCVVGWSDFESIFIVFMMRENSTFIADDEADDDTLWFINY